MGNVKMKFLIILSPAAVSQARNIHLRALDYGFCAADTPQPLSINVATVDPFPIPVAGGAVVNVDVEFDLLETCPAGTSVSLKMVHQGLIDIPIPCIEVDTMHLGSCEYGIDHLLELGADYLCPTVPEIPSIIGDLLASGTYRIEADFLLEDGSE